MKKQSRSFEIALAAIACAVAALALTLGSYVDFLLAAGYLIAVFALMIPLAKGQILGYCLAFAGAVILSFLFTGFVLGIMQILPFLVFFGLHPLANYLQKKYVGKPLWHVVVFLVKAVWFDFSLWVMYILVFNSSIGDASVEIYRVINDYILLFIFIGGTIIFLLYDYVMFRCQRIVNALVYRINR